MINVILNKFKSIYDLKFNGTNRYFFISKLP